MDTNQVLTGELMRFEAMSRLGEAEYAQPICTALQVALVRHLARYRIVPKAVVGHSSGEIAAAYAAGVLTLKEAIIVAYYRGFTAKRLKEQGAMAAIGLGRDQVTPFLAAGVTIACENSNYSITLSGDVEPLEGVCNAIKEAKPDALVRLLKVDKAYHSRKLRLLLPNKDCRALTSLLSRSHARGGCRVPSPSEAVSEPQRPQDPLLLKCLAAEVRTPIRLWPRLLATQCRVSCSLPSSCHTTSSNILDKSSP